jgi:hypothetical protein
MKAIPSHDGQSEPERVQKAGMNNPTWKQTTIGWFGEYRGLTCRVLVDRETDRPSGLGQYSRGRVRSRVRRR